MADTKKRRENPVANEPFEASKALKAIDVFYFDDGGAKVTFLKNVPVKDPNDPEKILRFDKQMPYEFVKGIPRNTPVEKITLRHVKIIEISQ